MNEIMNYFDLWGDEPTQDETESTLMDALEYQDRKLIKGIGNTTIFTMLVNAACLYKGVPVCR